MDCCTDSVFMSMMTDLLVVSDEFSVNFDSTVHLFPHIYWRSVIGLLLAEF